MLLHARVLRTEVSAWCIGVTSNIPCCHLPCNRRAACSRIYTDRPVDGPETSRIFETECGLACVVVSERYCCHNGFGTTTQRPGANICREINTGVSMHIKSCTAANKHVQALYANKPLARGLAIEALRFMCHDPRLLCHLYIQFDSTTDVHSHLQPHTS